MNAPAVQLATKWPRWLRSRNLAEAYESGADNFLLLRFVAAVLVMYGHSYAFAGTHHGDFLSRLNWGNGIYTGSVAVDMFFAISGLLVTGSYLKRANLEAFIKARALRILPAYLCCIVLSALVLGALYTELPLGQYWSSPATWHYIYANSWLGLPLEWKLPGVFTNNFLKETVNGSIWTLPAEVRMYAWVAILGLFGVLQRRWLANAAFAVLLLVGWRAPDQLPLVLSSDWVRPAGFFLAGAFCYVNRNQIPVNTPLLMIFVVLAFSTHGMSAFALTFGAALTYSCLWLAYIPDFHFFNRFGDYSYGAYLWGFPVQQAVAASIGHTKAWVNCAISLVIVLAIAAVSWHWMEKPALRLKDKVKRNDANPR
jgi:peptidoglycan/LPS O-acetylase OafA/YrhL